MVPISRGKQLAGVLGAMALGYTLSWLSTPGPGSGPVDTFGPTFGQSVAPIIVTPPPARGEQPIDASEPLDSSPQALQPHPYEPI